MKWTKKGLIYKAEGKFGFDFSHCHKPTPFLLDEETIRLYFGVRDRNNKTRTTFIDLNKNNLKDIKYIHNRPVLDLGKIGTFDDSGAQVCSVVRNSNEVYLYYIGWNTSTTVPSRNALGLARSVDNGFSFERVFEGPILERYQNEPYHIGASDIIKLGSEWRMWYNSGQGFKFVNGKPEYTLYIKYASSHNGIDWIRHNINCIVPLDEHEIIGRPSVILHKGKYMMWYSRRSIMDFRTDKNASYRAGYAESSDGIEWQRKDKEVGINIADTNGVWDSEMLAYPYVIEINGTLTMFYNGNGFGESGVGYAILT
ncbi:hypothetical protein ACE1ET_02950 [Saccharicrinis sp. FJH62]|uniref:hypothetical protein n=1 Tax=Saccharicrinis sp. FJH62 TaxID=3344657 RepID=UPI0035D493AD